ncbi:MAG: glycosyltransferase family 4 protein, partial [Mesorhizobium sp.]
ATSATPLVLADIPTYRELWNGAAMFYDAHDPRDLARCLDRLSDDAQHRRRLGGAAARRARKFSPARQAAAMHKI